MQRFKTSAFFEWRFRPRKNTVNVALRAGVKRADKIHRKGAANSRTLFVNVFGCGYSGAQFLYFKRNVTLPDDFLNTSTSSGSFSLAEQNHTQNSKKTPNFNISALQCQLSTSSSVLLFRGEFTG